MAKETLIRKARNAAAKMPVLKVTRPIFDRAVAMAGRRQGVAIGVPGGGSFRFDASLFRNDYTTHEPRVYEWVMNRLPQGGTFYDLGAWIGLFSLGAAERVGPRGCVVAVEPSPDSVRLLRRHLALNGFEDVGIVVEGLVGDRTGTAPFFVGVGPDMENSMVDGIPGRKAKDVPVTTLDALVAETGRPPDVVKIDVEGAEHRVLQGARKTLVDHRPLVVLAVHPRLVARLGDSVEGIARFVDELGYRIEDLDGNRVVDLTDAEVLLLPA